MGQFSFVSNRVMALDVKIYLEMELMDFDKILCTHCY